MTIGTPTNRVSFNTDGVTTVFPVNLQSYLAADFTAILTSATGVETTLTLNSDYSLISSGTLAPPFWTLTRIGTVWANGQTLQVFTDPVRVQQSSFVQGQAFPSLAVQTEFDRLTQMIQRLWDVLNRTVRAPDGDVSPQMQLLPAAARANTFPSFDALGNIALSLNLPTGALTQALFNAFLSTTPALTLATLFPRSQQEIAAGVTPVNYQYSNSPHDIRRYSGWHGDGVTDDSAAWISLAAVVAQGGNAYIPPGNTYVASQVIFTVPSTTNAAVWGYGVQLYTNNGTTGNAIDGLQFTGGGNTDSLLIYGITYVQVDALATSGFNLGPTIGGVLSPASSVSLIDCQCWISNTVRGPGFICAKVIGNGSYGYWNKFYRFQTRQTVGAPAIYPPYAIALYGQANATLIRDCTFSSVNYAVVLLNDAAGNLPNAVVIDGNAFEGGVQAIYVSGNNAGGAGNHVEGLRITNNRAEAETGGFLQLFGIGSQSNVPTWLSGNYLVSNATPYLSQNNGALTVYVNSMDLSYVPALGTGGANLTNSGQFTLTNLASTGGLYDVINAIVQSPGGGYNLTTTAGAPIASLRYKAGGSGALSIGGVQVMQAQIAGYGTPTGGARQASFAAGSITLPNLAAAVAQLIIDLKAHGMIGT